MDIPSEVMWIIVTLIGLGIVAAIVVFLSFHGGAQRMLEVLLGFFR